MAVTRKMVSLGRDVRIATTTGHVLRFEKGVPKSVPRVAQPYCEDKGVTFVDDTDAQDSPRLPERNPQGRERLAAVQDAMLLLARRQDSGDFTGGGVPDLKALAKLVDFPVLARERNAAWEPIVQQLAGGVDVVELKSPVRAPSDG